MGTMRIVAAALAVGFALAAAGCGSVERTSAAGELGRDAATLVPPDSLAFVSIDTRLDSEQWQVVEDLTGGLKLLRSSLREQNLDLERDVRPALGDELNLAVLGLDAGKPEAVALAKPEDEAKLRALAAKFDEGDEHYTVERIGGWSVVADSAAAFEKVRGAESGRSLADVQWFQEASSQVSGDALALAYADGAGLQQLPAKLAALVRASGSPSWVAARAAADKEAVQVEVQAGSPSPAPAVYRPRLLREVPSGAILALSFKNTDRALKRLAAEPALEASIREVERSLGLTLASLMPGLRGEGVFYVLPGALLPIFVLEVESPSPQAAARALRLVAARIKAKTGNALPVQVLTRGNRVFLTDGMAPPSSTGALLVDDQGFKDALAAADVPAEVSWLAYADLQRLTPLVQALSQLLGRTPPSATETQSLERLDTLVAFGAQSGQTSRVVLRLTIH
jgi:Protein of unknown function (DUF3352)